MFGISNVHPIIVHFPIALIIVGFLFDLANLILKKDFYSKVGFYLMILGSIGVIAAYLSGESAGDGIVEFGALKSAMELHEEAAELTVIIVSVTVIFRIALVWFKKYTGALKLLSLVFLLASVVSITRTGHYGGQLVYKHAAGVEFNLGNNFDSDTNNQFIDEDNDND